MDNIQSDNIKEYFNLLIEGLNNLVNFYGKKELELKYSNKDFNIYIAIINKDFNFDNYFEDENNKYEPYINPSLCLNELYSQSLSSIIYIGINYKISKYISNYNLYWENVSPIISIQFLNKNSKNQILISNCDSYIKLYFPISKYQIIDVINSKKKFISPENQNYMYSNEFKDPIYIDNNGNVYKSTVEERRKDNLLYFNFSCEEIISSDIENNYKNISKSISLEYNKYTNDNYIICITSKLISNNFNEFVVEYKNIDPKFSTNSRFFYLKRFELFKNKNNYIHNPMTYYYSILFFFGIILTIIFLIIMKKYPLKYSIGLNLKKEIVKINLPYENINEFDLIDNININEGDKRILNNLKQLQISKYFEKHEKNIFNENEDKNINKKKSNFFKEEFIDDYSNSSRPLRIKNIENNDFFKQDNDDNNNNSNNKEKVSHFFNSNPPLKISGPKKNNIFSRNKNELNEFIKYNSEKENLFSTKSRNKKLYLDSQDVKNEFKKYDMKKEKDINAKFEIKYGNNEENNNKNIIKKSLPKLDNELTNNKLLFEYNNLEITPYNFFIKNMKKRYIIFNLFSNHSLFYHRSKRILNFIAQLSLYTFFLSILFTLNKNLVIIPIKNIGYIFLLIIYSFISIFLSCLFIYFSSLLFNINILYLRQLYSFLREGNFLVGIKIYDTILKWKFYYNLGGILIDLFYIIISIYFSFGFCATYLYQNKTFIIGIIITIINDLIIYEIIYEMFLALLYKYRKNGSFIIKIGEFLNRLRTIKSLN